jgi:predicted AlkP superfamily pyrophosphatase or phosphodiesterase
MEGRLPQTEITRRVVNGFYPKVSGDIVVVTEASYFTDPGTPGPYITTHGSPYTYDTHVPILIAGPGIKSGIYSDPVSPADIAPTLCALLGVGLPSGCDGVILRSVLR